MAKAKRKATADAVEILAPSTIMQASRGDLRLWSKHDRTTTSLVS